MSSSTSNGMDPESVVCPICGDAMEITHIYKIYSDLLIGSNAKEVQGIPKKQLTIMLSPPRIIKNGGLSSINPDVFAFILLVIFVYLLTIQLVENGPYTQGYGLGNGILIIAYWLLRRKLMAKYDQNKHDREKLISELRVKADIWMEMVYCKKDNLVFTPDHKIQLKLEQLRDYWQRKERDQG